MLAWIWVEGMSVATLFAAYRQSETMGKFIIWLLFVGSVVVWCIMMSKRIELRGMGAQTRRFLDAYRRSRDPLELARRPGRFAPSPVETIYLAAAESLIGRGRPPGVSGSLHPAPSATGSPAPLTAEDRDALRSRAERVLAEQMLRSEHGMSLLATATTTAPFLGLLGTVWGVMSAFQGMMGQGVVLLANVAPGISGALATTVVGLMVALPSAIGYNFLSDRVRALHVEMENFVEEFLADMARVSRDAAGDLNR